MHTNDSSPATSIEFMYVSENIGFEVSKVLPNIPNYAGETALYEAVHGLRDVTVDLEILRQRLTERGLGLLLKDRVFVDLTEQPPGEGGDVDSPKEEEPPTLGEAMMFSVLDEVSARLEKLRGIENERPTPPTKTSLKQNLGVGIEWFVQRRELIRKAREEDNLKRALHTTAIAGHEERLDGEVVQLRELVESLARYPEDTLVSAIKDNVLLRYTTPKVVSATKSDTTTASRADRLAYYTPSAKPGSDTDVAIRNPEAPVDSSDIVGTEVQTMPIDVDLSYPWLKEPVTTGTLYRRGERDLVVVRAMEPAMVKISQETRRDMSVDEKGRTVYDTEIEKVVQRLLDDIMPWENANSIKRTKHVAGEYDGVPIWYTFDTSSNAPRVYFTYAAESPELPGILTIVGEGRKAQQLQMLHRFTGLSVQTLRQQGAGSI